MMQLRGWEEQPELSAFRLGDFRSNTLRSHSGVDDPLSSTSSTDLDREQVSSTQCGGRRRMHGAQHKKRQRIGKRKAASLSAASNQKPKNKLLHKNNTAVSELSISSSSSSSHQEQKLRRNKQPDHNTKQRRHNRQKRKREKKNSAQILSRKVSLFLSQTETAESKQSREAYTLRSG